MSKLIQCTECEGEGMTMDVYGGPDGPIEMWEECDECSGEGEVEDDGNES